MGLNVKIKKNTTPPVEVGVYQSVCVGVIDLGEQLYTPKKTYSDKILFIFELPDVTIEVDGVLKPRWISADYTVAFGENANLGKMLKSWIGGVTKEEVDSNNFSFSKLLGLGAFISVEVKNTEKGDYNNITTIMALPKGMPAPKPQNPLILFDMDNWDDEVFERIPTWIQDKIKKSTQYPNKHAKDEQVDFPKAEPQQVAEVGNSSANEVQPQLPIKAPF